MRMNVSACRSMRREWECLATTVVMMWLTAPMARAYIVAPVSITWGGG